MGRHIRWQAILSLTGIAMTIAFLSFLSLSRRTVTILDEGGIYREAVAGTPQFINPLLAQYNQVDQDLVALIFNGLTRMNGQGELEPDLAESWEMSDDGLIYVFELRENIRWQDGERLTADDVLFTTELLQDPDFPGVPYLAELWQAVTVEKLDDYTVRFTLAEPLPTFADFTTIGILPSHRLQGITAAALLEHPFNLNPIGTGPFQLDEVNVEFAALSPSPFYNGLRPKLDRVELRFYPSTPETITAYEAGEVEGISYIPPQQMERVQAIEGLNLYTARLSSYQIIYLNLQNGELAPFFQELGVRQALLHALNRQQLIDEALHGQGLVAHGPIRAWSWAYHADQPRTPYNLEAARSLLDEAGWVDSDGDGIRERDGRPFAFTLLCGDAPNRQAVAEAVSQMWAEVGLDVQVEIVGAGLGQRLGERNFQAALAEVVVAGDPDPYPLWHQTQIEGGQNYAGWDNTQASKLLEAARSVADQGRRNDFYFEFQEIFGQDVPSLVLFHPVYTYGVSQEVQEVQMAPLINPSDRFRTLSRWYLLNERTILREATFEEVVQ